MNNVIYARSMALNTVNRFKPQNRVHSVFENGINIMGKDGLVFIGSDKNGQQPFGIYLNDEDIRNITGIGNKTILRYEKEENKLVAKNKVIDLNKAYPYTTKLTEETYLIKNEALVFLLNQILEMDLDTGLDMKLNEIVLDNNQLILMLRNSIRSQNKEYIKRNLRRLIGRGKGLTPSGDDLLLGIIWLNDIKRICSNEFLECLKELVTEEQLTTDISLNYYKAALSGDYSSKLVSLSQALLLLNKHSISSHISQIVKYGHTSGRDTLSGIALGIDLAINIMGSKSIVGVGIL